MDDKLKQDLSKFSGILSEKHGEELKVIIADSRKRSRKRFSLLT